MEKGDRIQTTQDYPGRQGRKGVIVGIPLRCPECFNVRFDGIKKVYAIHRDFLRLCNGELEV